MSVRRTRSELFGACRRECDEDARASARFVSFTADRTAVRLVNFPAKIQPDTSATDAFVALSDMVFHAKELLEDSLPKLGRDTRSLVRHGNLHCRQAVHLGI